MPRSVSKLLQYFEVLNVNGSKVARCNYCRKQLQWNGLRLRNHCTKACKQFPKDIRATMLVQNTEDVPVSQPTPLYAVVYPKRNSKRCSSPNSFSVTDDEASNSLTEERKHEIDILFARAIFATGTPIKVFQSRLWQKTIRTLNPNYVSPTKSMLSTNLLHTEYVRIRDASLAAINKADTLTLVVDGWSDVQSRMFFLMATPKPYYFKTLDPGSSRESPGYLFTQIMKVLDRVGKKKVFAVLTDNSNTMKVLWKIIDKKASYMYPVGCASHTMNLILKEIMKIESCKRCLKMVIKTIKYIKKHPAEAAHFKTMQIAKYGRVKKPLLLPKRTQSATRVYMMESLMTNRDALEAMVKTHDLNINRIFKQHMLTSEVWATINSFYCIFKPLTIAALNLEYEKATLSDVPQVFGMIREGVYNAVIKCDIVNENEATFIEIIDRWRESLEKPIHYAANILDPRYRGKELSPEKLAKGKEFINQYATAKNLDTTEVMSNLEDYQSRTGFFSQPSLWNAANQTEPRNWWRGLCGHEIIAPMATSMLSVPPTTRNQDMVKIIHSVTRVHIDSDMSEENQHKLNTVRAKLLADHPGLTVFETPDDVDSASSDDNVSDDENSAQGIVDLHDAILKHDGHSADEKEEDSDYD